MLPSVWWIKAYSHANGNPKHHGTIVPTASRRLLVLLGAYDSEHGTQRQNGVEHKRGAVLAQQPVPLACILLVTDDE